MTDRDRERFAEERADQQVRALHVVDGHATDDQDRAMLVDMLGLDTRAPRSRAPHLGPLN
ncbi:hypothetical protein ALI144C_19000 [Actinosynnema sp. ALI-1.44]|nr:hypothetical protein ALI144C_19000 [Actinosynnema sp. ALI-1.44]